MSGTRKKGRVKKEAAVSSLRREKERITQTCRQKQIFEGVQGFCLQALRCETVEELARSFLEIASGLTESIAGYVGEVSVDGSLRTIALSCPQGNDAVITMDSPEMRKIYDKVRRVGTRYMIEIPLSRDGETNHGRRPTARLLCIPLKSETLPQRLIIEVADTGNGIAREDIPKVMKSFYTTKPGGKGTGLGLAICRRIIQENYGTISIGSSLNTGTKVRISFPIQRNNASEPHQREMNYSSAAHFITGKRDESLCSSLAE